MRARSSRAGDPDNPLGKYRIELTLPMYGIHGTNIPWGVGMLVSHGCVRLYPEDIEHLFPLVQPGMPGEFTYQPVKAGVRAGVVYVEAHRDIYGYAPALYQEATAALARAGLADRVDQNLLQAALEDGSSMPDRVSPEPAAVTERTPDQSQARSERTRDGVPGPEQSQTRND